MAMFKVGSGCSLIKLGMVSGVDVGMASPLGPGGVLSIPSTKYFSKQKRRFTYVNPSGTLFSSIQQRVKNTGANYPKKQGLSVDTSGLNDVLKIPTRETKTLVFSHRLEKHTPI